jgi:hypothetical protein
MESLLAAVAGFIDDSSEGPDNPFAPRASAWSTTLERLGEEPVTMSLPENTGIQGIRASDPAFDLSAFLVRVCAGRAR